MSGRVKAIVYKGTIENRGDSYNLLSFPGDFVIVQRGVPRLMILRCPCGCGDDLMINLDSRSGPAWKFYVKNDGYTLYPSYWREGACGSHFIVWSNRIYWCNRSDDNYNDYDDYRFVDEELEKIVLQRLKSDEFTHYFVIAEDCDINPWDCLQACKQLVRKGFCLVGSGRDKTSFKKGF